MRSRAVSFPLACWRSTASVLPAWSASSLRAARSARRSAIECSMAREATAAARAVAGPVGVLALFRGCPSAPVGAECRMVVSASGRPQREGELEVHRVAELERAEEPGVGLDAPSRLHHLGASGDRSAAVVADLDPNGVRLPAKGQLAF